MAARFWVGGTGTWDASDTTHWSATSGGAGGQSVPGAADTVTLDASSGGGTVTVNTNFSVTSVTMGAFTGTLDFSVNNNSPTMNSFNVSGTGTRTVKMGSGTWTLTGNNATIWNASPNTNLTLFRSGNAVICNYSGSTGTRTINHPTVSETADPSFNVIAGTDIVNVSNSRVFDLDLTGFSGTLSTGTFVLWGSLTIPASVTVSATGNSITFAATSGIKTIATNGVSIDRPVIINGAGGTFQLSDALTIGATRTFTLTAGVFDANNKAVSVGLLAASGSSARSLLMGTNTWTLSGTGTVWNTATTTNLTFNASTSTIAISDTSASSKTFAGGSLIYNKINITAGGAGAVIIQGSNTFDTFTINAPKTVTFTSGTTQVVSFFVATGTAGNVITINSSSGGSAATLSKAGGSVSCDYLSLQDSAATGGANWYAGANSTNVSGNSGWIFTAPPVTVVSAGGGNSKTSMLSVSSIARI